MNLELTIFITCLAIIILLAIWIMRLESVVRRLLVGKDSKSLADSMTFLSKEIAELQKYRALSEDYLEQVENRLRGAVRGVHTVRFNPFSGNGSGGNQSFATALIDENKNGVVVSSLYSRDRVSVFSKPVVAGASEYELTEEERQALEGAVKKLKAVGF
jgi:hypothetical protein